MFIMNGARKEIVNSEFVERFCIAEKDDATLIVASYGADRPAVTLARYRDKPEAMSALNNLMAALIGGQSSFDMPESLLFSEERLKRDARTKRRGGS